MKRLGIILYILLLFIIPSDLFAAQIYDLATDTNWNIRFNSAYPTFLVDGRDDIHIADLDNDGFNDIIYGESKSDANGSDSGSVYIIYGTLLQNITGSGNVVNLSDSSSYNIRIDGKGSNSKLGSSIAVADIDQNGKNDLIVGALYNTITRTWQGSIYVIKDSILDDFSGTGNIFNMSDTNKFNFRFDGGNSTYEVLGDLSLTIGDLNNNGIPDIVTGGRGADYNGNNSGVLYVVFDSIFSALEGTGNTLDLNNPSNYNIRFVGASSDHRISYKYPCIIDINGDHMNDLIIPAPGTDYNSKTDSGSNYILYNYLINSFSGTGNNLVLSTSSTYNIRMDGADPSSNYTRSLITIPADINADGNIDFINDHQEADYNDRDNSGSIYIVYNDLFSSLTGIGNTFNTGLSSNYNLRIDGAESSSNLGYEQSIDTADFDGDQKTDIFIGTDKSTRSAGALYVIYNGIITENDGVGNTLNLENDSNYNLYYIGPGGLNTGSTDIDDLWFSYYLDVEDLNNDEKPDLLVTSYKAFHLIYNFPHTILVNSVSSPTNNLTLTGTISASNSITNISGVQYLVDSNSPTGSWSSCTADDGTFNSTSEDYTCSASLSSLSDGSHTIYIRSYDDNTSYTAQSNYGSVNVTYDTTSGTFSNRLVVGSETGATITYTTDEVMSTQAEHGTTDGYGTMTTETDTTTRVTSHSVSISNLTPCTVYHYRLKGTDEAGNNSTSSDSTFKTNGCADTTSTPASQTTQSVADTSSGTVVDNPSTNTSVILEPNTVSIPAYVDTNNVGNDTILNLISFNNNPTSSSTSLGAGQKTNSPTSSLATLGTTLGAGNYQLKQTANSLYIPTTTGNQYQIGNIKQINLKSSSDNIVINSSSINKSSVISLKYTDDMLINPGVLDKQGNPIKYPTKYLRLAYSSDGITWSILPSSVVDPINQTVAGISKPNGYYMIVGSFTSQKTSFKKQDANNNQILNSNNQNTKQPKTIPEVKGESTQSKTTDKQSSTDNQQLTKSSLLDKIVNFFKTIF